MHHANGSFDVKVTPQTPDNDDARSSGLSRLSINKQFHGPLAGTSHGEMLASGDGKQGGAYVALETVTGTLDGRSGSFVLMHSAEMVGGKPRNWTVRVVAESGSGDLAGLSGDMTIRIESGKHHYDFAYRLDRAPD
jgi:hypothetical protein